MITNIKNKQLFVLLNELKSGLVELYGDRLFSVILFGSHARGEATSESDIDVMVVLADPVNTVEERSRMSILFWYFLREYDELISQFQHSEPSHESKGSTATTTATATD